MTEPVKLRDYEHAAVNKAMPGVRPPPIMNSVLEHIGNTPLIKLNSVSKGLKCNLYAKCEFFNAGGSVKDRIGYRMVMEAEMSGRLKKGDTVIEPTSGNTGVGLALACAVKGYRCIIVLPEKMSQEKIAVLKALGAEIVRTPTEAAWDAPESHINVAAKLSREIPNAHVLDQYINPNNPDAHVFGTGPEIVEQLAQIGQKCDMIVAGTGTGGTLTGISKAIKKSNPELVVVGVDPLGSILAQPEQLNETDVTGYQVEGTGYDFIPDVLDRTQVHKWIKTHDNETFVMARRLIKEEGILCGGSSGGSVWAAIEAAKDLKEGENCVVVLADSVRNYMTKFLADDWMYEHQFWNKEEAETAENSAFKNGTVQDLKLPPCVKVSPTLPVGEAAKLMKTNNFDQLPVCNDAGKLVGLVTLGNILSKLTSGKIDKTTSVEGVMFKFNKTKVFHNFSLASNLSALSHFFEKHSIAFISDDSGRLAHVATNVDLLTWLL